MAGKGEISLIPPFFRVMQTISRLVIKLTEDGLICSTVLISDRGIVLLCENLPLKIISLSGNDIGRVNEPFDDNDHEYDKYECDKRPFDPKKINSHYCAR